MDERIFNQSLNSDYSLDSLIFQTERMDINKLFQVADTFDLILFKNKNFMSKFQRFLTNSDYDHVAMILKTHDNQHFILESTSNSGVAVYSLKGLIDLPRKKYYNRYICNYQEQDLGSTTVRGQILTQRSCRPSFVEQQEKSINSTQCI